MYPVLTLFTRGIERGESMKARILASLLTLLMGLTGCVKGHKDFLYTAGPGTNEVFAFTMHEDGSLTALGTPNFSVGSQPSSIAIHPPGDFVYITNFAGANLTQLNINTGNGSLAIPPVNSALLFVTSPSTGTVSVFGVNNGDGSIAAVAGSPFAVGATGATPTWVTVDPSGKFLYIADSVHNAVLAFSIGTNGSLTAVAGSPFATGAIPTHLAASADGTLLFVSNSGDSTVSAYVINGTTGALGATTGSPFLTGGQSPGYLVATGAHLYVADTQTNDIAAFTIGANGVLSPAKGSPFNVPVSPAWIALVSE